MESTFNDSGQAAHVADPEIARLRTTIERGLTVAKKALADGTGQVQRHAKHVMAAGDSCVREQPWQAAGIGAAVGRRARKSSRSLGFRIRGRNAEFRAAVRQRNRDRSDLDFRDAVVLRNADLLRRGRREVDDPTLHIRPAVLDLNYGALAGLNVGHRRRGTQWKRLTRGVFAVRIHFRAVRHFSARKLLRIVRCVAEARAAR